MSGCKRCGSHTLIPKDKDTCLCGHCGAHFITSVTQEEPLSAFEIQNPFLLPQLDFCGT